MEEVQAVTEVIKNKVAANSENYKKNIERQLNSVNDLLSFQSLPTDYFSNTSDRKRTIKSLERRLARSSTKVNFSKWTVTPFVSADLLWNHLKSDFSNGTAIGNQKNQLNDRENYGSAFSVGALISRQLSSKFGMKSGIVFSNTKTRIDEHEIFALAQPDGSTAYRYNTSLAYGFISPDFGLPPAIGDSIHVDEGNFDIQTVSIPLTVTYRIAFNQFSITPSLGFTANFIAASKLETVVSDGLNEEDLKINDPNGQRQFFPGMTTDIMFTYDIMKGMGISLWPSFGYALASVTKNNVVKTYPFSLGIGAGLSFKF